MGSPADNSERFLLKILPVIFCLVCVCAVSASAETGTICLFSDVDATSCDFVSAGFIQIRYFHLNTDGATGCGFRLDHPDSWTHFGDVFDWAIGNTNAGIWVSYGMCLAGPVYLGVSNYGTTMDPPCTLIRIVPNPQALSGEIEVTDCLGNQMVATGSSGIVNPDATCACGPVPVRPATRGAIKAMYQSD